MRRKFKVIIPIIILLWVLSFCVSVKIGLLLTLFGAVVLLCLIVFLILNKFVKRTNWWKNQYLATEQFVSNVGYRDNIIRNYDVVNLGSNPAHFAFFYERVKGQSWSTGSQGLDMDFEILKCYHSYLKDGATVLIPIMPFTAISPYLKDRPDYWGLTYYSKFAKILDPTQVRALPLGNVVGYYLLYPLFFNLKAVRFFIKDVPLDVRYEMSEQPMMNMELEQDAATWINNWLEEFDLRSLNDVTNIEWQKYYDEAIELLKGIVDFCIERRLKPAFVCVPMTRHLSDLFSDEFYKHMITDFIGMVNEHNIPFLDYTFDERFQDDNYYFNSFFMNLKGRKLFSRQILKDLSIN